MKAGRSIVQRHAEHLAGDAGQLLAGLTLGSAAEPIAICRIR
jgi:hypothetical protein